MAKSGVSRKWGGRAAYLLRIEDGSLWREKYASLSEFISKHAEEIGEHPQTLWRELSAGRYYNELREAHNALGYNFAELDGPGLLASAESLEIVRKISRVAPAEVAHSLQQRAMQGTLSRRKLWQMWETYRPVLQGKTARGRNVLAPRFDPRDEIMVRARKEADRLVRFFEQGPGWLDVERAYLYKVIYIPPDSAARKTHPPAPDVVILLSASEGAQLEIHGIKAITEESSRQLADFILEYQFMGTTVDFVWLAYPSLITQEEENGVPPEFGLIVSAPETGIHSARPARHARREPMSAPEELQRYLLELTNRN